MCLNCQIYLRSTFAVASSKTRIRFLRRIARAKHTSCLCPTDRLDPPSEIFKSNPEHKLEMVSFSFAASSALHSTSSLYSPNGSRFFRKEPENKTGSWGMMEIFERKSCRPMVLVSIPSIKICPSGSVSRNSAAISDDFPAPVRPTMPTLSANIK